MKRIKKVLLKTHDQQQWGGDTKIATSDYKETMNSLAST